MLRIDLLIKLALAVLLGGIIGFERELAGKPAGLRTNILICIGAASRASPRRPRSGSWLRSA